VGSFFGSQTYSKSRSEIILFMTPRVIYDTNDLLDASEELKAKMRKLKSYVREQ
jgi:general secretion pathway protein D